MKGGENERVGSKERAGVKRWANKLEGGRVNVPWSNFHNLLSVNASFGIDNLYFAS